MIESVHADDEPKGNGDDADGSRDEAIHLPIFRWRGFLREHVVSLHLSRKRFHCSY